jgi:hypothetical protein
MKKSFSLNLSNPCSEKWETFSPTDRGAFCSACSKEVLDFTSMSDQQIIDYFKTRPKNTCGKFRPDQFKHYQIQSDSINPGWKLWKAGLVAIALASVTKPSSAQEKKLKLTTEQTLNKTLRSDYTVAQKTFDVTGIVYDENNSPMPGLTVVQYGTSIQTYTDVNGKFLFTGLSSGDTLAFMFIGFQSQLKIVSDSTEMVIHMAPDMTQLGGIAVGGVTATNKISFRRWWWRLKGLFY